MAAVLWNRLSGIRNQLLVTRDNQQTGSLLLPPRGHYGTTASQLFTGKTTMYRTCTAARGTETYWYHHVMRLGIQHRLYVKWRTTSGKIYMRIFSDFHLYKLIQRKNDKRQLTLSFEGKNVWTLEPRYANQTTVFDMS
jgi:hypothetical protein